jgi:hypothetical protein
VRGDANARVMNMACIVKARVAEPSGRDWSVACAAADEPSK